MGGPQVTNRSLEASARPKKEKVMTRETFESLVRAYLDLNLTAHRVAVVMLEFAGARAKGAKEGPRRK